ncbi:hypothetical protein DINM_005147 [Dirofilaria immitis]|nr:hypothetical protein [Dirofilaria immitis]
MSTVMGTRFTSVTTSIDDDDLSCMESVQDESSNYEKLGSKCEKCEMERKEKTVLSDLNADGDLLAIAIGEDISIFSFDCGIRFIVTVHLGEDINPVAMKFMPMVNLVVIVTNCGNVIFLSIGSNRIIHRVLFGFIQKLMENKRIQSASISCDFHLKDARMCIGMASMIWKQFTKNYTGRDSVIISHHNALLLLSSEHNARIELFDLSAEILDKALDEFYSSDVSDIVRIRHLIHRDKHTSRIIFQFITALTTDGQLLIWDATTTMLVSSLQIRNFRTCDVIYTKIVSSTTFLLNKVTSEENLILFIQLFAYECSELNAVKIHAIYECQPDMRLAYLIYQQRWIEAEEFAQSFNLNMEKIYIARIEHFVNTEIMGQTDLGTYELNQFLGWMTQVLDQNWVAEMCIAAIMCCSSLSWVKEILNFVKKLKITGHNETKEKLSAVRYNYQSYRQVLGPWRKPYSSKFSGIDLWSEFLGGCSWEHIFEIFCKNGQFCEARLIWCRYRKTLEKWIKERGNFQWLLTEIHFTIHDAIGDIMEAICFLEEDIIPVVILNDPKTCCSYCKTFLIDVARAVEIEHPECFPENSFKIASTMERVIQNLLNYSITPCRQAEVAFALSIIGCYSEDPDDLMGELNIYVRNLRSMERLKSVYQFTMSYSTYQEQTVESICYEILERVKNVQLIKSNIDQYAKPYMNEFKLNPDRTLYNYILEKSSYELGYPPIIMHSVNDGSSSRLRVPLLRLKIAANSAGVVPSSNPWDERCFAIAESISNLDLRCEALIDVAKRAHPPWTKQLSNAIHAMLRNPGLDFKTERLVQYRLPMQTLERYLQQKHLFSKAIEFIFRQESVEADPLRRLTSALEFLGIVSCLNDLNETDRNRVINQLMSHVEALLNCPVLLLTEEAKEIRLQTVEAVLCILERFRKKIFSEDQQSAVVTISDDWGKRIVFWKITFVDLRKICVSRGKSIYIFPNDEMLRSELNAIRKLQVYHGMIAHLSYLRNNSWKSAKLRYFLNYCFAHGGVPAKITELLKFSNALMMEENTMYELTLHCALENRNPMAALEYAKYAVQDVKNPSEKLLTLMVRSCSYGLWIMSELAENNDYEPIFVMFGSLSDLISSLFETTCQNPSLGTHIFHGMFNIWIWGTSWRLSLQNGQYFFQKSDAIQQLSAVVRSVVFDVLKNTDLIDINRNTLLEYHEKMRMAWTNFLSYLTLNNQFLIAICARLSFALLPCYMVPNYVSFTYSELHSMIELFVERALIHNYADLELCVALIFSAPIIDVKKVLLETRPWCITRKSPHVMFNLIRLARFCTIILDDHSSDKQLSVDYVIRCDSPGICSQSYFTRNISRASYLFYEIVMIIFRFCKDFSLEITEALVLYATKMALKASAEEDQILAAEMRFTVFTALQVIKMIINEMEKHIDRDNSDQVEILRRASITIQFLEINERVNFPTDYEVRWYHERQKFLIKQQSGNYDSVVKVSGGEDLTTIEEDGSDPLHKRPT